MSGEKHVITYPGFAESKEARGLYPDIQAAFPDYTYHILPFYDEKFRDDGAASDRVVYSVTEHAARIQDYMDGLDGEITMLAKCGGCRPTVAMDDEHISRLSKLCLVNPPWKVSNEFLLYQLNKWGGTRHDDGSWTLARGERGSYVVTEKYVNDVDMSDLMGRYREIARSATKLYIVRSLNDEMFPPIRVEKIPGVQAIDIEHGNHHLLGDSRPKVLGALALHGVLERQ